jgi:hypothetical protein
MYNSGQISLPGQPMRPRGEFALNTGDNVYNTGSEDSYRDFWMPVWNSDVDSQDRGAPFIRSFKNYIVTGNHDIGGSGDFVNLLATAGAGPYAGQTGGGDALAYFNNYYFPLNGPTRVDPFYVLNGDQRQGSEAPDRPHEPLFVRLRQCPLRLPRRRSAHLQCEARRRRALRCAAGHFLSLPVRLARVADQRP